MSASIHPPLGGESSYTQLMRWVPARHWSRYYLTSRIRQEWHFRQHPDEPWLTPSSVDFLSSWLTSSDVGVEFGAGRSTAWLASRVAKLISVETDPGWHQRVLFDLRQRALASTVDLRLAVKVPGRYLEVVRAEEVQPDFILVDGGCRDEAALWSISRIRPGGIIVIDDAHRYLPSQSRSPYAVKTAASDIWKKVEVQTASWRRHWTTSGVSDTVIMFAPGMVAPAAWATES